MNRILLVLVSLMLGASPAFAHGGRGATASFAAGIAHPLSGLDHIAVMLVVGLWAWPAAFVGVMLVGGALGIVRMPVPFVEPGILASVVALGLLVALAVDLPVWTGALVVGVFGGFHGHAHGTEVAENLAGIEYMAAFALATATLHALGISFALLMNSMHARAVIRIAGAACMLNGAGLWSGVLA